MHLPPSPPPPAGPATAAGLAPKRAAARAIAADVAAHATPDGNTPARAATVSALAHSAAGTSPANAAAGATPDGTAAGTTPLGVATGSAPAHSAARTAPSHAAAATPEPHTAGAPPSPAFPVAAPRLRSRVPGTRRQSGAGLARPLVALAAGALLAACAPRDAAPPGPAQAAPAPAPPPGAAPDATPLPGTRSAYFATYPQELLQAAAEACDDPTQTVVRPSRDEVRCETLPAPEAAAALILGYEGTVEDLPRFVIAFRVEPRDEGFVVTAENYIRVPRRDAPTRQVRLRDPVLGEGLGALLLAAGGTPN